MGQKKLVRKAEPPSKRGMAWPKWTGFRGKTVWDFLQLLIVPLMLAAIGFWFTAQQDARQQRIENQRAAAEQELAVQRAQDEALQAYLDQMGSLLLEKDLRNSKEDSEVRTLAQARTATVIQRLDAEGNRNVIRFLNEAGLIRQGESSISILTRADLRGANLKSVDLSTITLSNPNPRGADLSEANLQDANLQDAILVRTNLIGANLSNANLRDAGLVSTNLHYAYLRGADLRGASLSHADLSNAKLSDTTTLDNADLREANLRDAEGITNEELEQQAASLEGATMPDGQKYEDWLKSKNSREVGENGGPS